MRAPGWSVKRLVLAAGILLGVAACGGLDHGTVTDLTHEPDASFWMPTTMCTGSGSSFNCTVTQVYYYIPECWHVWFSDGQDKGDDCVTPADWRSLSIGQYFDERR